MTEFTRLLWLIAFEVGVVALLVLCDALLPGLLRRTRQTIVAMPGRSFLVGLVNIAFFGVVSAAFLAPGGGIALIGGTLATLLLAVVAVGLAAVARIVGERLRPAATDPLRRFLTGAATLALASAVPFVGWFVVLPCAGMIGFGALLIAIVQRRAAPDTNAGTPQPATYTPPPPALPWDTAPQAPRGGDAQGWR